MGSDACARRLGVGRVHMRRPHPRYHHPVSVRGRAGFGRSEHAFPAWEATVAQPRRFMEFWRRRGRKRPAAVPTFQIPRLPDRVSVTPARRGPAFSRWR